MRIRTSPIPLTLAFLLALLIHSATLFLGTRAFTTARNLQSASPDTATQKQATPADRHPQPPSPPEPTPPPTPEPQPKTDPQEITLGSDQAHETPLTVAWIAYDDFHKLIAPQSSTIQPAQQPLADSAPAAPIELFPEPSTPPTPNLPNQPAAAPPRPAAPPPTPPHPANQQPDPPSPSPPPAAQDANPPSQAQPDLLPIAADQTDPTVATTAPTFSENPVAETDPSPPTDPIPSTNEPLAFAPIDPPPTDATVEREPDANPSSPPPADEPYTPQPQPTPAPPDPAPAAPTPQPASTSSRPPASTSAPRTDSQSLPTSLERATQPTIQPGGVLTAPGIEIKTVTPQFSIVTRVSAAPRNPLASIVFDPHTGRVTKAQLLESSGYPNVDAPIEASLYKWHATGSRLAKLQQPLEIRVRLILTDD